MESVTVKFQPGILKKVDKAIQDNNFNSRTEFIREAVRDKLNEVEKEIAIKKIMSLRGKLSGRTALSEDKKIREEISKIALKELSEKFD